MYQPHLFDLFFVRTLNLERIGDRGWAGQTLETTPRRKKGKAMLLIVEIYLTVQAWRNGWRGRALLPVGIGFATMFMLGAIMGAEVSGEVLFTIGLIGDFSVIAVLIGMCAHAPKPSEMQSVTVENQTSKNLPAETATSI
jgi:hypothetical protein